MKKWLYLLIWIWPLYQLYRVLYVCCGLVVLCQWEGLDVPPMLCGHEEKDWMFLFSVTSVSNTVHKPFYVGHEVQFWTVARYGGEVKNETVW